MASTVDHSTTASARAMAIRSRFRIRDGSDLRFLHEMIDLCLRSNSMSFQFGSAREAFLFRLFIQFLSYWLNSEATTPFGNLEHRVIDIHLIVLMIF